MIEEGAVLFDAMTENTIDKPSIVAGIIRGLGPEGFTKAGKPEVDAINDVLPEAWPRVTAAERDAAWAIIESERAAK